MTPSTKRERGLHIEKAALVFIFVSLLAIPNELLPNWLVTYIVIRLLFYMSLLPLRTIAIPLPIINTRVEHVPVIGFVIGDLAQIISSCSVCSSFMIFCILYEIMIFAIFLSPTANNQFYSQVRTYFQSLDMYSKFGKLNHFLYKHPCYFTAPASILIYITYPAIIYIPISMMCLIWLSLEDNSPPDWREQFKIFLFAIYEIKHIINYKLCDRI
jgi:uncharacterized protein YhhL (DUF1145 family)